MKHKGRGGDSNKQFQGKFFNHQASSKGINKDLNRAEKNRSEFSSTQEKSSLVKDHSLEILALNVAALASIFSK